MRKERTSGHSQRFALAFEFCFEPARGLSLFLPESDEVLLGTIIKRPNRVRCCDVDQRTTKVDGAHYGGVFKGMRCSRDK